MRSNGFPAQAAKDKKVMPAQEPSASSSATAEKARAADPLAAGRSSKEKMLAKAATSGNFEALLERHFRQVKELVGAWKAHIIMGTALHMLEDMQRSGQSPTRAWLPGAFLSVATAISGIPDDDEIRPLLRKHLLGKATNMQFRESESLLAMAIPFQRDLPVG